MGKVKRPSVAGFSLVEVLIALAILMMVLFVGNLAYRTYSVYWQKEFGSFQQDMAQLKGITNVYTLIRNIKPMVLKGGELGGYFYFDGGDSVIRSIGNQSISNDKFATAFEIKVVPVANRGVAIEYREFPMSSPVINEEDIGSYGAATTILTGFEDVRFEYYGWPNYQEFAKYELAEDGAAFNEKKWFGLYSGKDVLITPEIVKLRLKKDGVWSEIKIPLTHFRHQDLLQFVGVDS